MGFRLSEKWATIPRPSVAKDKLTFPAVKRLMREAEELRYGTAEYHAQPLEDNLFEWHFTLSGPSNTEFEGGVYHGRITLPPDYPMKPPSIILLTPNGRFEINKKICLSISGYHPESWQPSWSIRTALLAIIGFLPTHGNGAIGSLDYTPEERKELALKSQTWKCPQCGLVKEFLAERGSESTSEKHSSSENEESQVKDAASLLTPEHVKSARLKKFTGEEHIPNLPSGNLESLQNNDNFTAAVAAPSNCSQANNNIQCRQQTSEEVSAVPESSDATQSVSSKWSSKLIGIIVVLLGILIFRRFCL